MVYQIGQKYGNKTRWEDLLVESEASVEEIAEELEDFDFQDG